MTLGPWPFSAPEHFAVNFLKNALALALAAPYRRCTARPCA
jgi:hypothetical protein